MNIRNFLDGTESVLSVLVPILAVMAVIYIALLLLNDKQTRS